MRLKGKKIGCFVALPLHTRFFLPIRERISEEGGDLLFFVPLTEYPFELDLLRRGLPFRYYTDYIDARTREKIKGATRRLLHQWTEQCYKWDGFSRWPLFKQSWFFEALLEEIFCLERFVEVEKPDMLIASHECSRWGKAIGYVAHRKSIPFVTFQEGDYHTDQMAFTIHTEYSTMDLLWGARTMNFLGKYGCSPDKMFPIGNTHIDGAINEYAAPGTVSRIKKELNIPPDKKVILFLLDILYGGVDKKEFWQEILQGLDATEKEAVCIFKWHPHVYLNTYEKIRELFKELLPSALLLQIYEPYKLLAIADYCVTFGKTTLAVEAVAFGKPLFSFPNTGEQRDPYVDMGIAQTVCPAGNWFNLVNTIRNGVPAAIQEKVNGYIEDCFYKLDGRSVERTVDALEYIVAMRGERQGQAACRMKGKSSVPGRISFIIPSGKDAEALLATLTSLSQNVNYADWEVVLALNDPQMRGALSGVSGDVIFVDADSDSLAFSYNRGVEASSGEFLVFMRPGLVFFRDQGLLDAVKEGVTGIPIKNTDMTPYCFGIGYDFNFTPYRITDETKRIEAVGGGFIAMSREKFQMSDCFDEGIANHLIEPDLCLKAREKGVPVQYAEKCLGFNYKETFFGEDISSENWKARAKFYVKWVGKLPKDDDFLGFMGNLLKV